MTLDLFNTIVGVAGLILGFVASYKQIKAFAIRAMNLTGETAKRWLKKQDDLASFYLDYPSALTAYVIESCIRVLMLLFAAVLFRSSVLAGFGLPAWLVSSLSFVPYLLIGLVLGSVSSNCTAIRQVARSRAKAAS